MMSLDQHVQRLQNMEPFTIYSIKPDGEVVPWYAVDGSVIADLVIREQDIGVQVQAIAAQIAHWSRMAAQCKRVWQIEERNYRVWRSRTWLDIIKAPAKEEEKPGWSKTAKGEPKAPTKEQAEALFRVDPEYLVWKTAIERAEEAFNASTGITEAFKAKNYAMRDAVRRNRDASPEVVA